jgi:SPP1 gp7 family putative phage head morphogenesis protein
LKALDALANRLGLFPDPEPNGKETKQTGVSFVGPSSASMTLFSESGAYPEADTLTRAIALATSAYCFTATEYRWKTISEPPLMVVVDTDDGPEMVEGHRLELLLTDPSPDYDMGLLMALTEAYQLQSGGCLWVRMRDNPNGPTMRLLPYSADEFESEPWEGRIWGRFRVTTRAGQKFYFPPDVVHFREINPLSWQTPLSKLEVALSQLDLGHQVNRMIRNYARKAMAPGGVVSPSPDWNPNEDEFQQYVNRIRQYHAGPAEAGEPLVLLGGSTFTQSAFPLKELLPTELLDRIEATVGAVYGVPPVVLGWEVGLKNSPWSQMEEARRMTYEDTIEPRWHEYEKAMTRQLLTPAERTAGQRIVFDLENIRALKADDERRADTATKLRQEWTLNERRIYTGQEPLDDERGDEIDTGGGGGGLFGGGLGAEEMGGAGPPARKVAADLNGLHWLVFDGSCKAAESTWERVVFDALRDQKRDILKLAGEYLEEAKQVDAGSGDNFVRKVRQYLENEALPAFVALMYPLLRSTASKAVKQVSAKLGLSFTVFEEGLTRYAEREAAFLAEVMGQTTGDAVAATVQKGLEEGALIRDLRKSLETLPAFDRKRAQLTARTETTRAWNGSQREGMSDYQRTSGKQVEKYWLSSRDDRVRPEHDELDDGDTWYPIDAVFPGVGLTEPGEPNCRCTLLYRIRD